MGGTELALLANALLFMLALSVSFDVFSSDETSTSVDDEDDEALSPLFDVADYTDRIDGTDDDDNIIADPDGSAFAFFLKSGNDSLNGSSGADYAQGGSGNDSMNLFEGDDIVFGEAGDDTIFAGRDNDTVDGGAGDDRIDGSLGNDTLSGGDGADEITGGRDDDIVFGGDGDDILSGDRLDSYGSVERGIDTVDGGAGNDTLFLAGADTGTGGSGEDLFVVFNSEEPDSVVEITDFVKGQDSIELRYEPEREGDPAPTIDITFDPDTNDATVSLDGLNVLKVNAAADLAVEDIALAVA